MDKKQVDIIDFVTTDLLPEAVHNRCFCEVGSREFVEFVSAVVEPLKPLKAHENGIEYYRARLTVDFSGEPSTFALVIKLLTNIEGNDSGYEKFLNEEMFYAKMTKVYNLEILPKCFVADMGRYGRPVIVLEDLEACGYVRVDRSKLDEYHLELCLKAIARFHRRGLTLKAENYNSFREFYVKLIDTRLDKTLSENFSPEESSRILAILRDLGYKDSPEIESRENVSDDVTICHGKLSLRQSFFFAYDSGKPVNVRVIGWNGMRYCSIVFDLAQILQDNLAKDDVVKRLLAVYVESANK